MKNLLFILSALFLTSSFTYAQKVRPLASKNVLVIAKQNELSDRYSLEVGLMQLFSAYKLKTKASLNVVKQGGNPDVLMSDSVRTQLSEEGIDTYLVVSIRGYNNRYKQSGDIPSLEQELDAGHLFSLYRDGISNVTFTFTFYKDMQPIHTELVRTGSVGSKEVVMQKLLKKVEKRLTKAWL